MKERRRVARQKSFLRGCVYFNNRRNAMDCLIRDITIYGARLVFSDATAIPDAIDLYIPHKDQTYRTHVIWRHGEDVGVAFEQPLAMPASAPPGEPVDLVERVQRLENDLAALKRTIKQMKAGAADSDVA
jgi:hypothetical protein